MSTYTYLNCYELVKEIALDLDIVSNPNQVDDFVERIDINPKYTVDQIIKKINNAQRFIYSLLLSKKPEIFLTATEITGVSSVYALPFDFGRLLVFKDKTTENFIL